MKRVVVVGSGASAVHFAQSVLERGWRVTLVDVGRERPAHVAPELSFTALKREHADPAGYFLGPRFEGVLFAGGEGEYYGFPPHREYIFEGVEPYRWRALGFDPLSSFARGGLAEAWTGGVFPFNQAELEDFPFGFDELAPFYDLVAERIGITGADDDLARFMPVHAHLDPGLDLDEHSRRLLARYETRRASLNDGVGCWVGRSRTAVLREDREDRGGCGYLGRCLWGCPRDSIYTPSLTLRQLQRHPDFEYRSGLYASHFELDDAGRVRALVARSVNGGGDETIPVERLALGAGTLSSCRLVLESVRRHSGESWTLDGLMDNRQVLVPFVNLSMIGKPHDPDTYQYHQLCLGLAAERPKEYVHGLITTLKTALIHPLVQSVPFDLRSALDVFRNVHSALGIVNVNFHDTRRPSNTLTLEGDENPRLQIRYSPSADEDQRMRRGLERVRRALRKLGCIVPPGMSHVRPMGASVHYAGALPMRNERAPRTTAPDGASHDFENLWLIDGSTFPFLPAKNLTFTLMANAARIAARAF
jgi:choline dehydrogenase-like flavoprotein